MLRDLRIPVRHLDPACAVVLEGALRRQQAVFVGSHGGQHRPERGRQRMPRHLLQGRLGIEQIDIELGPPSMNSQMTDFAVAVSGGKRGASGSIRAV